MPEVNAAELENLKSLAATWGMRIIGVIILVVIAYTAAGWAHKGIRRGLERAHVDETVAKFTGNFARWTILVMAGVSILSLFGVQATSFAAIIAAAGLAVGLAFQGTLANFAAGVMLLVFRPFKVGDAVKVAGHAGKVDEIDLFQTALDTPDGRRIILPNSAVFGATIENMSYHEARRVDVDVQVEGSVDIDQAERAFVRALSFVAAGDAHRAAPAVVLSNVTPATIDFQLQVWAHAGEYGRLREKLLRAAKLVRDVLKAEANEVSIEERITAAFAGTVPVMVPPPLKTEGMH